MTQAQDNHRSESHSAMRPGGLDDPTALALIFFLFGFNMCHLWVTQKKVSWLWQIPALFSGNSVKSGCALAFSFPFIAKQ